jgi:hypothetical protein
MWNGWGPPNNYIGILWSLCVLHVSCHTIRLGYNLCMIQKKHCKLCSCLWCRCWKWRWMGLQHPPSPASNQTLPSHSLAHMLTFSSWSWFQSMARPSEEHKVVSGHHAGMGTDDEDARYYQEGCIVPLVQHLDKSPCNTIFLYSKSTPMKISFHLNSLLTARRCACSLFLCETNKIVDSITNWTTQLLIIKMEKLLPQLFHQYFCTFSTSTQF